MKENVTAVPKVSKRTNVRFLAMTAMLSTIAFVLQFLDFAIPVLIPGFVKMDISDLPELIGAFAMGPLWGAFICVIKNLLHLSITSTGGVGELGNALLGIAFVVPAGMIYKYKKSKKGALLASLAGAFIMGLVSVPINYFITYPVYYNFMPKETILNLYQLILPNVKTILQCLIVFNMPFTFAKGIICMMLTFGIYKGISPLIKGMK